jgi:predicted alpha/beta-hydrolase family hydrolase
MAGTVFVCAHGAGGHKDDGGMMRLARVLTARGLELVRFNFTYRERGVRVPDPMPKLMARMKEVAERVRAERKPARLILGGRSMGGRTATMLAAEGFECDGLLLAAYPLHPPGNLAKLRSAHLASLRCPVLCLNGTRDAFCDRGLMEAAVAQAGGKWTMHWLEGADHSFHVLKSSGRSDAEVDAEIGEAAGAWLESLK